MKVAKVKRAKLTRVKAKRANVEWHHYNALLCYVANILFPSTTIYHLVHHDRPAFSVSGQLWVNAIDSVFNAALFYFLGKMKDDWYWIYNSILVVYRTTGYTNSSADPFVYQDIPVEPLVHCGSLRRYTRTVDPLRYLIHCGSNKSFAVTCFHGQIHSVDGSFLLIVWTIEYWVIPVWGFSVDNTIHALVNMSIHCLPPPYTCDPPRNLWLHMEWLFMCVWFRACVHSCVYVVWWKYDKQRGCIR